MSGLVAFGFVQMYTTQLANARWQQQLITMSTLNLQNTVNSLATMSSGVDMNSPTGNYFRMQLAALNQLETRLTIQLQRLQLQIKSLEAIIESENKLVENWTKKTFSYLS